MSLDNFFEKYAALLNDDKRIACEIRIPIRNSVIYDREGWEGKRKMSRTKLKRKFSRALLMGVTGSILWGNTMAFATESMDQGFMLDKIVVTATRIEKTILDTPASVGVITAKDIEIPVRKRLMKY